MLRDIGSRDPEMIAVVQEIRDGEFAAELARVNEDTRPVECCGPAGTVIFWHPRECFVPSTANEHSLGSFSPAANVREVLVVRV